MTIVLLTKLFPQLQCRIQRKIDGRANRDWRPGFCLLFSSCRINARPHKAGPVVVEQCTVISLAYLRHRWNDATNHWLLSASAHAGDKWLSTVAERGKQHQFDVDHLPPSKRLSPKRHVVVIPKKTHLHIYTRPDSPRDFGAIQIIYLLIYLHVYPFHWDVLCLYFCLSVCLYLLVNVIYLCVMNKLHITVDPLNFSAL